jgi:hypothetical protein
LNKMLKEGVIVDHSKPRVVESLYELALPAEEMTAFSTLKSLEIEVE